MVTCGTELAGDAVVPEQLASLMLHVADNMEAHARWVGTETVEAQAEHDALVKLAADYRQIATAATQAVATMRGMRNLKPARHDSAHWDGQSFTRWMRKKIDMQRAFAHLLLEHAEASERILENESADSIGR